MLQVFMFLCFAFGVLCPYVAGETGCPPEEDIFPCKCSRYPQPRLLCKNITRRDDFSRVFEASKRYTYGEVRIENSLLMHIPVQTFEKTKITSLYVKDSRFITLLEKPVREIPDLLRLRIENTIVQVGIRSRNFTQFTSLRELIVKSCGIKSIPRDYGDLIPKSIKYLTFSENRIATIYSGAFAKHPDLVKLVVESNKLKELKRDIFPRPFNVVSLNFNNNILTAIPDDLFTDMPFLQTLSLENNQISTINEASFSGRESNVPNLRLEGNPLVCDCGLLWIIKDKPELLGGSCTYPAEMKGRELEDLNPSEISC